MTPAAVLTGGRYSLRKARTGSMRIALSVGTRLAMPVMLRRTAAAIVYAIPSNALIPYSIADSNRPTAAPISPPAQLIGTLQRLAA